MKMNRKRVLIAIAGLCVVTAAALILKATVFRGKGSSKAPLIGPMPTIPAEIPQGSVLVWQKVATYERTVTGKRTLTERYEYDEFGRCVRKEQYDSNGKLDSLTEVSYESDSEGFSFVSKVTEHDLSEGDKKLVQMRSGDGTVYLCYWDYPEGSTECVKTIEQFRFESLPGGGREHNDFVVKRVSFSYSKTGKPYRMEWTQYDAKTLTEYDYDAWISQEDLEKYGDSWTELIGRVSADLVRVRENNEAGEAICSYTVDRTTGEYKPEFRREYHDDGMTVRNYDETTGVVVSERTYDKQGRSLLTKHYDREGTLIEVMQFRYEETAGGGTLATTDYLDGEGNLTYRNTVERDAEERVVRRTQLEDGVEMVWYEAKRDDQGRVVAAFSDVYDPVTTQFEYDEYGNCVKKIRKKEAETTETEWVYYPVVLEAGKAELAGKYYSPVETEP